MIKAFIIDNDGQRTAELIRLTDLAGCFEIIGKFENGMDALMGAVQAAPQAAIINIEMPDMDGLVLAEKLLEKLPEIAIIYVAESAQYAVNAFELNALDYLLRPVSMDRFNKMTRRLCRKIQLENRVMAADSSIQIRCVHSFEVRILGIPVIWKRTKAEELFAFLVINHDEYIHKDLLVDILWTGVERGKALAILQTTVCKIRSIFSKYQEEIRLIYADNKYGLFLSNVKCDYFDIEEAIRQFDEQFPCTYEAVIVAGEQFGQWLSLQSGFHWSEMVGERIRKQLVSRLQIIADKYILKSEGERKTRVLCILAELSIDDVNKQIQYLDSLMQEDRYLVVEHYCDWLQDKLEKEYDAKLPAGVATILSRCKREKLKKNKL